MDKRREIEWVRRKTRRRLLYTGAVLVLYFSFVINWTGLGECLGNGLADSAITGSLLTFALLVIGLIALELLFLAASRERNDQRD